MKDVQLLFKEWNQMVVSVCGSLESVVAISPQMSLRASLQTMGLAAS